MWQTLQTQVSFSNPNDPHDAAEQICTNLPEYTCCAPVDMSVHGRGMTGFRAQWVDYIEIPPETYILEVWRYGRGSSRSSCSDILAAATGSGGTSKWSYKARHPIPGLSGGWYRKLPHTENEILVSPPRGVVWPDIIRFHGVEYTDKKRGDLF